MVDGYDMTLGLLIVIAFVVVLTYYSSQIETGINESRCTDQFTCAQYVPPLGDQWKGQIRDIGQINFTIASVEWGTVPNNFTEFDPPLYVNGSNCQNPHCNVAYDVISCVDDNDMGCQFWINSYSFVNHTIDPIKVWFTYNITVGQGDMCDQEWPFGTDPLSIDRNLSYAPDGQAHFCFYFQVQVT